MRKDDLPSGLLTELHRGMVIPAMPLALNDNREFAETYQQALIRYYIDAGVGGLAVGVHSTQFEIRAPEFNLFEKVLTFAAHTVDQYCEQQQKSILKIAGVCGNTDQAVREAEFACDTGYHAALVSMKAFGESSVSAMVEHCRRVAEKIPIIGFYLQTAVGGCVLPYAFWKAFAELDNVLAIKIAPFNRYQTLDVLRGVCAADKEHDIALYTGNDDNIIVDLLTPFRIPTPDGEKKVRISGGLLGQWGVWTKKAVDLLTAVKKAREADLPLSHDWLTQAAELTDINAAVFDAANKFQGVIPGIHEVLYRQGLLPSTRCLNPEEKLSPGQKEEIDRVYASYPHWNDDAFVRTHLQKWLKG